MEIFKENTHKCNKTFKKPHCCVSEYYCKRCHGLCIFSKAILAKFTQSRAIRKMVNEKYYKNEFALLRSLEPKYPVDLSQDIFEDSDEDGEEDQGKDEKTTRESYKLLQKFHKLSSEDSKSVFKTHLGTPYASVKNWPCKMKGPNTVDALYFPYAHHRADMDYGMGKKKKQILFELTGQDIFLV